MSIFAGILSNDWKTITSANTFGFKYIPIKWYYRRKSLANDRYYRKEQSQFGESIAQTNLAYDPIFILGHWRSGTTMLHNMLCRDEQFAFPNLFESYNPHTFLSLHRELASKLEATTDQKRPMDNVKVRYNSPAEDEFALALMSLCSPVLGWTFPQKRNYYDRYLFLNEVSDEELKRWQHALIYFSKKLTYRYQKQLLFKSPQHTARIKLILQLFPNAKFIHFRRNPYDVYQSTLALHTKTIRAMAMHPYNTSDTERYIITTYRNMYTSFVQQKALIPQENYCELSYEDFIQDSIAGVRFIYETLKLDNVDNLLSKLTKKQDKNYARNAYPPIEKEIKTEINKEWQEFFHEWNYQFV